MIEIKTKSARFCQETIILLYDDFSFSHTKESCFLPIHFKSVHEVDTTIFNSQLSIFNYKRNDKLGFVLHNFVAYGKQYLRSNKKEVL